MNKEFNMKEIVQLMEEVNSSQKQSTEVEQEIFKLGFKAGIQYMMDKIEHQYELGKPILANDNLYWLKGAKESLRDIMDDINDN